jgi:hypothetical protein
MRHVLTLQYQAANEQEKLAILATLQREVSQTKTRPSPSESLGKTAHGDLAAEKEGKKRGAGGSKEWENMQTVIAEEMQSFSPFQNIETKLRNIFTSADANRDGVISYHEFLWAMTGMDFYLSGEVRTVDSDGGIGGIGDDLDKAAQSFGHPVVSVTGSVKFEGSGGAEDANSIKQVNLSIRDSLSMIKETRRKRLLFPICE